LRRPGFLAAVAAISVLAGACRQDMHDNPRYEPLEASTFFADGRALRMPVEHTVARGSLRTDEHLYTGKINGQLADTLPVAPTSELLARGRERFDVFCSPCHGRTGSGDGMVVRRGFRPPPTLHSDRLRSAPVGYFFDAITNGFGAMQDYAAQVPVPDRWAIAAYIRALQISQHASVEDVPADKRATLDAPVRPRGGAADHGDAAPGEGDRGKQGH
jgi:mono/diheme cytochrome c family protein